MNNIKELFQSKKCYPILMSLSLCLMITSVTFAWVSSNVSQIDNKFKLGSVDIEIHEDVDNPDGMIHLKENVAVKNIGESDVYVRLKLITNCVDDTGNVLANPSIYDELGNVVNSIKMIDLIEFSGLNSKDWIKIDDIYYYKKPLNTQESTTILFESAKPKEIYSLYDKNSSEITLNQFLVLNVLSEAIQVNGVIEAWNVELDDSGNIVGRKV